MSQVRIFTFRPWMALQITLLPWFSSQLHQIYNFDSSNVNGVPPDLPQMELDQNQSL